MRHCDDVRRELGGHALGGLEAGEQARVDEHLRTCGGCRDEAAELAEVGGLLDLVAEAPPSPPPHLRARVLAATARRRKARRRMAALVAAALVAGALIGGTAVVTMWPLGAEDPNIVALAPGEEFDADGVAELRETDDGLRIRLQLDDMEPLSDPAVYEAWLSRPDAEDPISIGRFAGSRDGQLDLSLRAEGTAEDYAYIWITAEPDASSMDHEGPTVLAAPLHEEDAGDG